MNPTHSSAVLVLLLSMAGAASAAQQTVKISVVDTYAGSYNFTSASGSASFMAVPCGEPVPADSNPPARLPGAPVPSCTYASSGVTSFPVRFTRANVILTTEDGRTYSALLYCQRQLSECPKLQQGEVYVGRMPKNAILDTSVSKPVWGPPKVNLRPDGRHRVSYTIYSLRKVPHVSPVTRVP
jgi:hypothetical protein